METITVVVGDSPAQCVTRALAACKCPEPEGHALLAPQLLAMVKPNTDGDPAWPFALVLFADGFDTSVEGVSEYTESYDQSTH